MYLIKHSPGLMVAGINRTFNCVRYTNQVDVAKKFKTEKAATAWNEKYMNAGYLCGVKGVVVPVAEV